MIQTSDPEDCMKLLEAPVRIAIAGLGDVALQHKRAIDLCEEAVTAGVWTPSM